MVLQNDHSPQQLMPVVAVAMDGECQRIFVGFIGNSHNILTMFLHCLHDIRQTLALNTGVAGSGRGNGRGNMRRRHCHCANELKGRLTI
jgi:hypothetical protein